MKFKAFAGIKEIIKQNKKVFWAVILVVVLISAFSLQNAGKTVEVKVISPVIRDMKNIVEQTGEVETVQKQDIYVLYGGRVDNISVEIGQYVKQGQLLAELDLEDLRIRLEQAQAQLAQTSVDATLNAEIAGALAEFERAVIERDRAKQKLDSAASLFEMGSMSEWDYQQSKDTYDLAELRLNAAVTTLEAAKEAEKSRQASIAVAQSEVMLIQRQMEEGKFVANMNGVVLEKNFEEGMIVSTGSLLMRIGDPSNLQAVCMFLASEATDIKQGDAVLISGEILNKKILNGRVKKVFPQAVKVMSQLGVEQQRVPVEIEFLESHEDLKPGFSVDVEVITGEARDVLAISRDAVFKIDARDPVFVVDDGKAKLREIITGLENRNWIQIVEGLEKDDQVILDHPNGMEEGVRIKKRE